MRQLAPYLNLGAQMATTILVLGGVGWWIDSTWQSTPWGLIVGLLLGSALGLTQFLRMIQQLLKKPTDDGNGDDVR
jgi:F0F1-type ATP synthase assembly protein I